MQPIKGIFILLLICAGQQVSAQHDCNCSGNLRQFIGKVSRNYSGYQDKVNTRTRKTYDQLTDSLKKAALSAKTPEDCFAIMEKYRLFFEDKHLQMRASFHKRQYPPDIRYDDEITDTTLAGGQLQWKLLNPSTLYIRIKRCNLDFKPVLDSLLQQHQAALSGIPDWIIDFRGNTGGNTDAFSPLLPYLYTKPRYSPGEGQWMSTENTALFRDFYEKNKHLADSATAAYLQKIIAWGTRHPNSWYRDAGDTLQYSRQHAYPKRVAVLSDRQNGSSGETFLMMAKGISDKVTIFGENSAGYLDYGNLLRHTIDCKDYQFGIPARRANYLDHGASYDKTGYPADVYIPAPQKHWINFVMNYWKKKSS